MNRLEHCESCHRRFKCDRARPSEPEAGCFLPVPEAMPAWDELVDGARERYIAGDDPGPWLEEQAAALLREEAERRAFTRGGTAPLLRTFDARGYARGVISSFERCDHSRPEIPCSRCRRRMCSDKPDSWSYDYDQEVA